MNSLFSILNTKMFNVLSSNDKELNSFILLSLYDYFCGNDGVMSALKSDVVLYLERIINFEYFKEFDDEENNELTNKSKKEKILYKLNMFKKYGWLEEEDNKDYETLLSLNNEAIRILAVLDELTSSRLASEFSGYVSTTFNNLRIINEENISTSSYTLIEQAYENTKKFKNLLYGMNSLIKKYTNELLNKDNYEAKDIAYNLFNEYQEKVGIKLFSNIKGREHPRKYTQYILNFVNYLLEPQNLIRILENYKDIKRKKELKKDDYLYVEDQLKMIYQTYFMVDNLIDDIDRKNNRYLKVCEDKIKFIINESKDIEQSINNLLKEVANCKDFSHFEGFFDLNYCENVDDASLFKPRSYQRKTFKEEISNNEIFNEEDYFNLIKKIKESEQYSFTKINEFAKYLLKDKEKIEIKDIDLDEENLFIKIFLLDTYQYNENAYYKIKYLKEHIQINSYKMQNFELWRK